MVREHGRKAADEVWEPGAGVEAAGGHCPGLNRIGVACLPSRSPYDAGDSEWKHVIRPASELEEP
jgi:hypothetical protein